MRSLAEAEAALREVNKRAITANIDARRLGTREHMGGHHALSRVRGGGRCASSWISAGTSVSTSCGPFG